MRNAYGWRAGKLIGCMTVLFALAGVAAPRAEQGGGDISPHARKACMSDYRQFCPGVRPGEGRVVACFEKHATQLSPGCHAREGAGIALTLTPLSRSRAGGGRRPLMGGTRRPHRRHDGDEQRQPGQRPLALNSPQLGSEHRRPRPRRAIRRRGDRVNSAASRVPPASSAAPTSFI